MSSNNSGMELAAFLGILTKFSVDEESIDKLKVPKGPPKKRRERWKWKIDRHIPFINRDAGVLFSYEYLPTEHTGVVFRMDYDPEAEGGARVSEISIDGREYFGHGNGADLYPIGSLLGNVARRIADDQGTKYHLRYSVTSKPDEGEFEQKLRAVHDSQELLKRTARGVEDFFLSLGDQSS